MNTLENLNGALQYIEENLQYEIDEQQLAKRTHCSLYHFKRMFSYLAGISLQEYIRRRRLTRAAFELQEESVKVIDIAVKYGYSSADAFTRAFQGLHGLTPSEARTNSRAVKAYPPMTFRLSIGGSEPMKYRIVSMDSFEVVGITNKVTAIDTGEHPGVEEVWLSTTKQVYDELKSLNNIEPYGILHVDVSDGTTKRGDYDYYMAVATTKPCPSHFTKIRIPASTWVIFEVKVPWEKEKWHRIYGEWFPSSGYEQVEGSKIQVGPEIIPGKKQLYTEEVDVQLWIPVRKTQQQ